MKGEEIVGILLTGHAELVSVSALAILSQLTGTFYQLTRSKLLAWRALQVVVSKRPAVFCVRTTGAISSGCWSAHTMVGTLMMLYWCFLYPPRRRAPRELRLDVDGLIRRWAGGPASQAQRELQAASDSNSEAESGPSTPDNDDH